MKIQSMFQKDIDRPINGVVKVMQDDQQSLKDELSEYIITKELRRHFATFFDILNITPVDFAGLYARFDEIRNDINMMQMSALDELLPLAKCAEVLVQKYDVVVTNPPYLSSSRFSAKLNDFVIANYPDVKADLSMVMYKHALRDMCHKNGFVSFITTTSWMFLSSFEKLRRFVFAGYDFVSLIDFGTELFDGKVGHNSIVAWVNRKSHTDYAMTGIRLVDYCYSRRDEKEPEFFNKRNYHYPKQSNFSKIPGSPVAYWVSEAVVEAFASNKKIGQLADPKQGSTLGDNATFIRYWFEIGDRNTKWFNCMKGGEFRRWYGNQMYVLDWEDDGRRVRSTGRATIRSADRLFQEGITWSNITSGKSSFRYMPEGFFFESTGSVCFSSSHILKYILAYLNTPIAENLNRMINPTLHLQSGDVAKLPLRLSECKIEKVSKITDVCIDIAKKDWDSYETSWDFKKHPLI